MRWETKARIGAALGWAVICLILLYLLAPTIIIAVTAFSAEKTLSFPPEGLSLKWFEAAISYRDFQTGFVNSIIIAGVTSVTATTLGAAFAIAIDRFQFTGKKLISAILLSPLVIPHFVLGLAALLLAVWLGYARGFETIIATHLMIVVPFVIRSVLVSLHMIDQDIERAAASLGASPPRVLFMVTLPMLAPGLFGGWLFSAILSFTEFSGSLFVSTNRNEPLPVAMFTYIRDFSDPTMAALSTLIAVFVALMLIVATKWLNLVSFISPQHEPE